MFIRIGFAAVLLLIVLASCSKDDSGGGNDTIPRSKVDATVNGSPFYATEPQAALSGENLSVVGVRNLGTGKESSIVLQLKHYKGPGAYSIDTATLAGYTELGVQYTAVSGQVVITDINSSKYAGTFGFRARGAAGTVRVTKGIIDIYK